MPSKSDRLRRGVGPVAIAIGHGIFGASDGGYIPPERSFSVQPSGMRGIVARVENRIDAIGTR
jgi:hypothetical protein